MSHLVVVASPKGGVGRTMLVAQLAMRLSARGKRCLALDLDPQNALALQLAESPSAWVAASAAADGPGIIDPSLDAQSLAEYLRAHRASVAHAPFGAHDVASRRVAERELAGDTRRLGARIRSLLPPRCEIVLIDTPAGRNVWADGALALADLILVPLLAEPACLALVPAYEMYLRAIAPGAYPRRALYLVNRLNPMQQVACDVLNVLSESLPNRVLPRCVLDDEELREALARGEPQLDHTGSQAAADFEQLTQHLLASLTQMGSTQPFS